MRIISDFKDYYDYLAWQYGVDDEIIFHRNRLQPLTREYRWLQLPIYENQLKDFAPQNEETPGYLGSSNWYYYETPGKICEFEYFSILGDVFFVLYEYDRAKKSGSRRLPKKIDYLNYCAWREKMNMKVWGHFIWPEYWAGIDKRTGIHIEKMGVIPQKYSDDFIDVSLHEKLGMPILWLQKKDEAGNATLIQPQLSLISGFSGLYPAEKIYRDIYNFLQKIRSRADVLPPVNLDNESKISKAGFDLKTSFRKEPGQKKPRRKKRQEKQ